ncbi:MAG: pyridoxal-phosphate dependent enzyme, partial [Pyrinomonadaceae bacterium]
PVGGGGLISGIALGLRRNAKETEMLGAEPLIANDASQSLQAGHVVANPVEPITVADGARTISLGSLNWEIIRESVSGIIEVTEDKILQAVKLYFHLVNLKCEPTGALSLGAVLMNPKEFEDKKVCLIVSGGNVDPANYASIIQDPSS